MMPSNATWPGVLCGNASGVSMVFVTRRSRLVSVTLAAATIVAAPGCARVAVDPGRQIVAEVGAQLVTSMEVQAYLDANLFQDPAADPPAPGDLARVKSRLFDDFLDGTIFLQEAHRRGIAVSDAELSEYLGNEVPAAPAARETARRDLTIQKLREAVVLADVRVDDAEIDAWLAMRAPQGEPALQGTLRTLRLASYPEAMRVRQEILGRKLSFAEAERAYGADSLPDAPRDEDLDVLPAQIAAAVRALKPGGVSAPLPFESSVLLFLLESTDDPTANETRRRERARRAIALEKSQIVVDRFRDGLRRATAVIRHTNELPFAYVAEEAAARAQ